MNGEIAEGVVPGLLRELYAGRRSGTLHLSRGRERQSVRLRHGHIVNAHTNVTEERLGEILVQRGLLSAEDLARATEVVIRDKKRLGAVLLDLGLMDQSGLEDAVAFHVHSLLAKVFRWTEGSYAFEEEEEAPGQELTLKLSTAELILEAARAIRDPDVIRYLLGDRDRVLALSDDPLLRFQQLALSPTDGFVLSRVDGTLSAREIEQMIPLPEEEVQRSLFGLLSTGILAYEAERRPRLEGPAETPAPPAPSAATASPPAGPASSAPPAAPAAAPPPATPVAPIPPTAAAPPPAARAAPAAAPVASPPAASAAREAPPPTAQAKPASPPAGAPAEGGPAPGGPAHDPADERRREVLEAWEGLKTKNHFEVLGLPRASTASDVKEAYFRLARRFHPDVHHSASLGDLRDKLEAVFIRLGEAYEVLGDTDRRREYEEKLGRLRPKPGKEPAPVEQTASAAPDPEEEANRIGAAIRRAEGLYDKEQYWDAIQVVEPLLERVPPKMRLRARLVLARAYLKNPNWAKRGEETLLAAVQHDPDAAEAYGLLGNLYRERGLRTRAVSMFKRVLELRPEDEEAKTLLAKLQPDAAPPADEGGGLLKKIFRR
jgi:tetratricopeptide (TPR) repeat protein